MKNIPNQSRRNFIRNAALATGTFMIIPGHVLGRRGSIPPSDMITLGFIGTGKLIRELHPRFAAVPGVRIVAGCDVDSQKLQWFREQVDTFNAGQTGGTGNGGCKTFSHYEELLEDQSIDAVVVATPDHWHAIVSIAAIKSGKDVYCEKPLTHTVKEGRAMVIATREHQRVVQTGSMQRSWKDFRHACELVVNGYVGDIKKVIVNVGDPPVPCDLEGAETPGYLDWDRWLGPAKVRPYSPVLAPPITDTAWPRWREYMEFGGGGIADWGAHMFDIAQWGLGMDESGPVKLLPPNDPTAKRGLRFIYANGIEMFHEDFGRGWAVRFIGTEGSLDISREFLDSKPENIAGAQIKPGDKHLYYSDNHYADWIDAIKKRSRPVADVEIGHRSATVCNIANIAYQLKRPLKWDPVEEKFLKDGPANRLLTRNYRRPYTL